MLVKTTWKQSFARVHSNKKAICERGWFALNKALQLHPLVLKSKPTDNDTEHLSFNNSEVTYDKQKMCLIYHLTINILRSFIGII